jgi:hypothetical protein
MTTVKRFEVGDTKGIDDGSGDKTLLIGCSQGAIVSLVFDNSASHAQMRELERLLAKMRLLSVHVQTEGP